ncbi:uncharacterized protein LOC132197835 [Neocloeon triangulifer]|uniref:uncharacterized protein LOC132197835 n=1 Tax=Neocloeon triangulifer TaxID=2078957 RepID=UPI00286F8C97|nr:uncharacterized protein LOC132197835 [Neocloeon triangulifer]
MWRGFRGGESRRRRMSWRSRDLLGAAFVVSFALYAVHTLLWVVDDIQLKNLDFGSDQKGNDEVGWCPSAGEGPSGVVVSAPAVESVAVATLHFWSAWALARSRRLRVALPRQLVHTLRTTFANFSCAVLEDVALRCNASHLLAELESVGSAGNAAQVDRKTAFGRLRPQLLVVGPPLLEPDVMLGEWRLLARTLAFRPSLRERARRFLQDAADALPDKGHHGRVEFVGVLAAPSSAPNASAVFTHALAMMRFRLTGLGAPLFVVVCGADDERQWCHEQTSGATDAVLAAAPAEAPLGLALLAFCNHSVFPFDAAGVITAARTADGSNFVYHFGAALQRRRALLTFLARVRPPWFQLQP